MEEKLEGKFEMPDLYRLAENEQDKVVVRELMAEYPQHFVPGIFDEEFDEDYGNSQVLIAELKNVPVATIMFNLQTNEFNWLAVTKKVPLKKTEVAKSMFGYFIKKLFPGDKYHWFVNTEDAVIEGQPNFSGESFEPARRLYKNMGVTFTRIENKYGPGSHAYKAEGVVPEKKKKSEKEYLDHYLGRLQLALSEFSDEVPEEIIHSTADNPSYKVRAAWWSSVSLNIDGLAKKGLIPKEFVDEYKQIFDTYKSHLKENNRTRKEDIEKINDFLKRLIDHLS